MAAEKVGEVMNEPDFRQACVDEGYGEAEPLTCEPNHSNDMHEHEFSAYLFVQKGAFTVITETGEKTHGPGDTCKVSAGTLHAERVGSKGASVLVGRKAAAV